MTTKTTGEIRPKITQSEADALAAAHGVVFDTANQDSLTARLQIKRKRDAIINCQSSLQRFLSAKRAARRCDGALIVPLGDRVADAYQQFEASILAFQHVNQSNQATMLVNGECYFGSAIESFLKLGCMAKRETLIFKKNLAKRLRSAKKAKALSLEVANV